MLNYHPKFTINVDFYFFVTLLFASIITELRNWQKIEERRACDESINCEIQHPRVDKFKAWALTAQ